ncbi:MAG: PAS domain S-box protein [Desulfobacteraceae bacterium]|nr:PAS domain S-box protein [Desulfobacteraceae bacterium]
MIRLLKPVMLFVCIVSTVALAILYPRTSVASTEKPRHVLMLHSYHSGMPWLSNIEKSIQDTLLPPPFDDLILHIEYMDTKRIHSDKHYSNLKALLGEKYKDTQLSLILSSDNNAFDFLRSNRDILFFGVPVVFCGVNGFEDSQLDGISNFTGVEEVMPSRDTVQVILKNHPDTKEIFVINDYLTTGRMSQSGISKQLAEFEGRVKITYNDNLSIGDLKKKIGSFKDGTVILLGVYFAANDGRYFKYETLGSLLAHGSSVPVYCLYKFYLKKNVVGGKLISGYHQGKMMSKIARRILSGEKAGKIPVVKTGSNAFIFDWRELKRFDIPRAQLPQSSIILNEPGSFYREYFKIVWSTVAAFTMMGVLVIFLTKNIVTLRSMRHALSHSERKYRSIFDNAMEGIFQATRDGHLISANSAFATIFGYDSPEDAIACLGTIQNNLYATAEDRDIFIFFMDHDGKVHGFESKMKCKDGRELRVVINARSTTDQNGNSIFEGSIVDITDSKRSEEKLIQSKKRLRTIIDTVPSKIFVKNAEGRFLAVNKAVADDYGMQVDELVGKLQSDIHPDQDEVRKMLDEDLEILRTKQTQHVNLESYEDSNGITRWLKVVKSYCPESVFGEPAIIGNATDFTELKATEEALRIEKSRLNILATLGQMTSASLKALTDYSLENAITLTDSKIGYLAFLDEDETVFTMNSWSKSAMAECRIINKPLVYHINDVGLWGEAVRQRKPVITNNYAAPNIYKRGYPEEHVIVSRHMNIPIFDDDKIVGVAGVANKEKEYDDEDVRQLTQLMNGMWNIVQRKRSEDELHDINIHLEERIEDRTKELSKTNQLLSAEIDIRMQTEKEIINAKEIAEKATKAKSEFIANMSHEIRTPMNAVIGMTHLAKQTELSTTQQDYLDKIDLSAQSLLGIINDILDMSKIEAGMLTVEFIEFNIDLVLEQLATVISPKAREKKLEFLINIAQDVPHCLIGDSMRLSQVLINLCTNAVKFTAEGEDIVTIETVEGGKDQVRLRFSVKDNGIGIESTQIKELFQPFTQADSSTTRQYGGTGLGLNLCSRFIELMGGEIGVESEYGQGSLFWAELPFPVCQEKNDNPVLSDDMKGLPVLIVDDSPTSLIILKEMLTQMGMDVSLAKSGHEAIEIMRNTPGDQAFKLLIIDWRMPQLDGLQTAKIVMKDTSISPTPPMIMVSAYSNDFLIKKTHEMNLAGPLYKPINPTTIFAYYRRSVVVMSLCF